MSSGDAVSQDVNVKKNQQLTYGSLIRFALIAGLASSNRGTPRFCRRTCTASVRDSGSKKDLKAGAHCTGKEYGSF
jgi:hypothetical protein